MINAAKPEVTVPMKCDADAFTWWYQDQIIADINEGIEGNEEKNMLPRPYEEVIKDYSFLTDSMIEDWQKSFSI